MVTQAQSNLVMLRKLLIVAVAMFGFGFALVPFYQKICEVTGINNVIKADAVANTPCATLSEANEVEVIDKGQVLDG